MITKRINKAPIRTHGGFDQLFNEIVGFPLKDINESVSKFRSRPKSNIIEVEDGFRIELIIPGFEKSDIEIELKDSVLSIHSDKEVEKVEEKQNYTSREFSRDTFKRSFSLPDGVEETKISADLVAGILSVSIPKSKKAKEKEETKKIKIS
ncbi:MAG: HSP20 family protein [Arenicella sp.]|jgi:HSP20 family protein